MRALPLAISIDTLGLADYFELASSNVAREAVASPGYYAAVFDGVSLTLYRDGVDVYQFPSTYSTINWGPDGLILDQHDFFNSRFYAGLLDELGV